MLNDACSKKRGINLFGGKIRRPAGVCFRGFFSLFIALLFLGITLQGCGWRSAKPPESDSSVYKIVIPEGFTVLDIASRVEISSKGRVTRDEFLSAANANLYDYWFLKESGGNIEGFLFPKTYEITASMSTRRIVSMLLSQFEKETKNLNWERAKALGVTPHQVVIIASLIEKEVRVPQERELVSSVIYNRLSRGMRLEIDATVQYALKARKRNLSYEDLKVDSPYNTYRIHGLPPSPICNPGFESIRAALYPASTDYLFYVLTDPIEGRHSFTSDYQQFLRWKKEATR